MKHRHFLLLATAFFVVFGCPSAQAQQESPAFIFDHTQLDPQIIRVYSSGDNGTSARQAIYHALREAEKLCREKGYSHFYVLDSQTVYRQKWLSKQPSYTRRGNVETRGTFSSGSGRIQGGSIDIDYYDSKASVKHRRMTRSGTFVSLNDPALEKYSNKATTDRQSWAAITIRLLNGSEADTDKRIYSAAERSGKSP